MILRRHARRAAPLLLTTGLLTCLPLPATSSLVPPAHAAPRQSSDELTISAQDFAVDADGVFSLTVQLPAGFDTATLGADGAASHLVIEAHAEAVSVADVRAALEGDLPRVAHAIDIDLDLDLADPRVVRSSATALQVSVATAVAGASDGALRLATSGVHPITVTLSVDGRRAGTVVTFVARSARPGSVEEETSDLAVGIVLGAVARPNITVDGSIDPTRKELAELERLASTLEAIDAAAAALDLPPPARSVGVEPSTLAALPFAEPELNARLTRLLANGEVVARPRLPFDPSSAVAAGRADLYTRLLREGEDALSTALPSTRIDRSLRFAPAEISQDAIALLRDLGTQLVLLPYERYTAMDRNIGAFTDTSQLIDLEVGGDAQMPALLIDPGFAAVLESSAEDNSLADAIALASQIVALGQQITEAGGNVARHGIVLARSDGGVPDADLMGIVTRLLLEADGVRVVTPTDLAAIVDTQILDGRELLVTPVESAGIDLSARFDDIDAISLDVLGTASMLPSDEPLVASWTKVLSAVVSTALTEADAQAMIAALQDQVDVYRNGVQGPEPYSFRITGRSGAIVFKVRNLTDRPLAVRVRMSSAKLDFDDGDQTIEIPPFEEEEVRMPFEALSNGTSSVFLRIYTPALEPSPETQIGPDIVLTARITTLIGLGQLVTGAALLVLCTWWVRHWRQARRRRLADEVTPRHPASTSARLSSDPPPTTLPGS